MKTRFHIIALALAAIGHAQSPSLYSHLTQDHPNKFVIVRSGEAWLSVVRDHPAADAADYTLGSFKPDNCHIELTVRPHVEEKGGKWIITFPNPATHAAIVLPKTMPRLFVSDPGPVMPVEAPIQWLGLISYTHRQSQAEKDGDKARWENRPGAGDSILIQSDGKPFEYTPAEFDMRFTEQFEIGLRSDHTLVWRAAP